MRRLLLLALLALTFLTVACATTATTPAAANLSGQVTAVNGDSITVTPSGGGTPATVSLVRATSVYWPGGVPAEHTDIIKGHTVNVWLMDGTQTASRINIGY
jgi:hypothetical protein